MLATIALAAIAGAEEARSAPRWIGTWTTAPHAAAPESMTEQSLRMIVRTTIPGTRVRIRLSNAYGSGPITFGAASIGARAQGADVGGPIVPLTFGGQRSVSVAQGEDVVSDPAPLRVRAGVDLAVSFHVRGLVSRPTFHRTAFKTNYLTLPGTGDQTMDASGTDYVRTTESYLFLTEVLVESRGPGAIVALGSSSIDGNGTTVDGEDRWLNIVARRLQRGPACGRLSVLNEGVGGETNEDFLARTPRDVLARPGLRSVVLYGGSNNDIFLDGDSAEEAIAQTRQIVDVLRARGLHVVGGTAIPREAAGIPGQEPERQKFNDWVRTSGTFDAVIDFDAVVRDPARPDRYGPGLSDDGIHANAEGNRRQGESIDLGIFSPVTKCRVRVRLTARPRAYRRRRAVRVRTRGRVIPARGARPGACAHRGKITVRLGPPRRRAISRRRVRMRRNCGYAATAVVKSRRLAGRRRVRVTVRYGGNSRLRSRRISKIVRIR